MIRALTKKMITSDVNVRLTERVLNPIESATGEASNVIGRRELLIDTNVKAGDIAPLTTKTETSTLLIRCSKTGELCFPVFNFNLFKDVSNFIDA